ncbi:phosphoserine phosphatase SerB [Sphingorhabdus sp. IMCC26285]|uniref:Phosphoserine phosphatase n=1 Tax=Sphingorhabdus profundilacus TaxID=2509718 RepID=A0A6I4LXI6_9SPHN|nr:phosphoserine phosphatase SerB [Sphingorhabdus profundilacus]MVZ96803.1 phosphoserine phosphatase SerB [Sphingorhabdus profundilacus]
MPIATLIAADLTESGVISEACDRLAQAGCIPAEIEWIDTGKALDIGFTGDIASARRALSPLEADFDIICQSGLHRRKMLLVSDMDSTMITVECIDELADYAGIKVEIAAITERAMAGELDFAEALTARVALLAGLDEKIIARCLEERVRPMPGAGTLVKTMANWGAHRVLVSGGFTRFADEVAHNLGFAEVHANILEIVDGNLTGALIGSIVDAATKRAVLEAAAARQGILMEGALAVGDGANDLPMIAAAVTGGGIGAGFRPRPVLATASNFGIRHNDLTALLYAQGVGRGDWADF